MARLRFLLPISRPARCALRPGRRARGRQAHRRAALYQDGPDGRYLLDGDWLFRLDDADQGVKQRWMRSSDRRRLEHGHGAERLERGDPSNASMAGGVGWYRKDFHLP